MVKTKSGMKGNDLLALVSKELEYAADMLRDKLKDMLKDKLMHMVGDIMECVQSLKRGASERHTLLIPKKCVKMALSELVAQGPADEEDDELTLPVYHQQDDIFLSLVHVALMIRAGLRETPGYEGLDIGMHDVGHCIPESLQLFLHLFFGGERLLDEETVEEKENKVRSKALAVAEDIVYGVSNGKKWTPKHIGLGSTLHHVTRSKDLVKLFHKAGHILSYDQILQVDTGLAESVLNSLDEESGTVIAPNLVQGNFVHLSADNIDILDETMDGKNMFHARQIAAWQRGTEDMSLLYGVSPSKKRSLKVPESIDKIERIVIRRSNPVFIKAVKTTWYDQAEDNKGVKQAARETDLAFNMLRCEGVIRGGWTAFNQSLSEKNMK